ncbi:zinc ribbon domain-containing protein [Catellatospora methionotrophica]|uniref:zinc ribbon domain-containing protein n=1 Tax=Catellatospora methionotrophica TaxID=121620 RepID=UPI0033D896B0
MTGRIRCPQCGREYIGTAADGRSNRYRHYVCWSRARYGSKAGCDLHRFNADTPEAAINHALLAFYTIGHDLIHRAIAELQEEHRKTATPVPNRWRWSAASLNKPTL